MRTELGLAFDPTGEPAGAGHTNWILTVPTGPGRDEGAMRVRLAALQEEYARSVPEAVMLREQASHDEVSACLAREKEVSKLLAQLEPALEAPGPVIDTVGHDLREAADRARADVALAEERHARAQEESLAMQDRQAQILTLAVHLETTSGREGTATRLREASLRQRALEARVGRLLQDVDEWTPRDARERCAQARSDLESARAALERGLDAYARGDVAGAEVELAVLNLLEEEVRGLESDLAVTR